MTGAAVASHDRATGSTEVDPFALPEFLSKKYRKWPKTEFLKLNFLVLSSQLNTQIFFGGKGLQNLKVQLSQISHLCLN